ncbi:MAG: hypothetical protein KC421_24960, partial [Anaerolineales bacterium]|nr:hypothetical protein [Anaerolineales bacterium]
MTDSFSVASDTTMGWLNSLTPGAIVLGPGVTRTVTATVGIPVMATPADEDITVITVTSQLSPTIFDFVFGTTRVRQLHGLEFEPDHLLTTTAGSTVTYTHLLTNTGNWTDSFDLSAVSSRGWPVTLPPSPITVTNGISVGVVVTLTVPIGGSGLTDTLHVTATSTISPAFTAMVTNTTIVSGTAGNLGVLIEPNRSGSGLPGSTLVYVHQVTNAGDIPDSFSLSAVSGNGWTTAVTPTALVLNALQSAPVTVTVTIPAGALSGDMDVVTVTARSDADAAFFDTAEDTTTVEPSFGVLLEPDNSGTANAGELLTYAHVLTNTGNVTDTFTFAASSSNGWVTAVPADVTVGIDLTTTVVVSLTIPSGASGLADTMIVTATSTTDVTTMDSAVNTTTVNGSPGTLGVAISPDNNTTTDAGTTIQYQHTVENTGTTTDDYTITAVSSQGWTITLLTTQVTLAPSETANISVRVTVPGTAVAGTIDTVTVTVTSNTDNAVTDTATDTTTVTPNETLVYLPIIFNNFSATTPPGPTPT